jgi:solute carrier family 25 carnitine/acylcarnitine transporter 20/29
MSSFFDAWKDLTAGIVGGFALVGAGHPLDTIKVRLQTQVPGADGKMPFTGAWDCAVKTVRAEGVRGLYKGMSSPMTGVPPIYAIVFGAYGVAKRWVTPKNAKEGELLSVPRVFVAGCITGVATTAITVPVELVKARLQIQYARPAGTPALYDGMIDCARKVFAKEGMRGLFRGTVATLWRDVPGSGVWFAAYEIVRRSALKEGQKLSDLSPLWSLFAGGMAGVCNWLAVFPIDVIKSRIQTSESGRYLAGTRGMIQCGRDLVAEGGTRALFKGLSPALVRSFPANAACFLAVDLAMRFLNKI